MFRTYKRSCRIYIPIEQIQGPLQGVTVKEKILSVLNKILI